MAADGQGEPPKQRRTPIGARARARDRREIYGGLPPSAFAIQKRDLTSSGGFGGARHGMSPFPRAASSSRRSAAGRVGEPRSVRGPVRRPGSGAAPVGGSRGRDTAPESSGPAGNRDALASGPSVRSHVSASGGFDRPRRWPKSGGSATSRVRECVVAAVPVDARARLAIDGPVARGTRRVRVGRL